MEKVLRLRAEENINNNGVPTYRDGRPNGDGHEFSAHIAVSLTALDGRSWRRATVTLLFSTSPHTVDEDGRNILPPNERLVAHRGLGEINIPSFALCGM